MKENVLAEFLQENRDEVVKVTTLDCTFDRQIMLEREEGRREGLETGREEGRGEGRELHLIKMIQNKRYHGWSIDRLADEYDESKEKISQICTVLSESAWTITPEKIYERLQNMR